MAMAMMPATVQSTARQNGGHQRVPATKLGAVLPQVFASVGEVAGDEEPRAERDGGRGEDHEQRGDSAFGGDDVAAAVGDGEPDVDGGDQCDGQGVDARRVEPPEGERRGGVGDADDETPADGGAERQVVAVAVLIARVSRR